MDPNYPQSFVNLLTGDNSQREPTNNMNIVPTPQTWQYLPQYPQQYPHPQYPQPPPNIPLQGHNVPPPPNFNYGLMPPPYQLPPPTTTTSSTPHPPPNHTSNESGSVASKWTLEEDRRLVTSWINVSTNPLIGADQKKMGFWTKIASAYNQHAPSGAAKRTAKVCNARWNRAAPLVSKWTACVGQAYRANPSGANENDIMQKAQDLYVDMVGKPFDLMHWWVLLKDQPKWEVNCDQSSDVASKRLRINEVGEYTESDTSGTPTTPGTPATPASEDTPTEDVGGLIRPIGRKAAKRKAKQKANDLVLDVVTKELSTLGTTNVKNSTMFERYVIAQEEKAKAAKVKAEAAKKAVELRDSYQRLQRMKYEDKILRMDIATLCPEDQARYGPMQEEIRSRYRQTSSSSHGSPSVD